MFSMSEPGRRSRTPSAEVERELLSAAEAVLVRDGPGGLTVRAVAAEAGIAPMGVYNPHFYAIMFEDAIPREHESAEVEEHARACFGALVRAVEMASAAGVIAAPDPLEAAQQIWSAVHGAVALELRGLVLTEDPAATYGAFLDTMIRGLAPR